MSQSRNEREVNPPESQTESWSGRPTSANTAVESASCLCLTARPPPCSSVQARWHVSSVAGSVADASVAAMPVTSDFSRLCRLLHRGCASTMGAVSAAGTATTVHRNDCACFHRNCGLCRRCRSATVTGAAAVAATAAVVRTAFTRFASPLAGLAVAVGLLTGQCASVVLRRLLRLTLRVRVCGCGCLGRHETALLNRRGGGNSGHRGSCGLGNSSFLRCGLCGRLGIR